MLHRLPRLQSLVVSHLPFFDHGALSSLIKLSQPNLSRGTPATTYHLRLLDASRCNNLTPQALAGALQLFPALFYLDLSETPSARYVEVLASLAYLPALHILKLQQLGLSDDDLLILIRAVGRNLRSLDIRRNRITDRGIQAIILNCIRTDTQQSAGFRSPDRPDGKVQRILDSDSQDEFIRTQLTTGFAPCLGVEGAAGQGVTHVYVSRNNISSTAASELIRCRQLRVLDLGELTAESLQKPPFQNEIYPLMTSLSQAKMLISVIERYGEKLAYLRVNHAVVTEIQTLQEARAIEMQDNSASVHAQNVSELDNNEHNVYEMPDDHRNELQGDLPAYAELEGSPVQPSFTTVKAQPPQIQINKPYAGATSTADPVSAMSPAMDATGGLSSPISPLLVSQGHRPEDEQDTMNGHLSVPIVVLTPTPGLEVDFSTTDASLSQLIQPHRRTYSGVLSEYEARLGYRQSQDHALLPSTLGQLRTLVLTSVPSRSNTPATAQRIIDFIKGCAEEEHWAVLRASVGYQLPPGPDRRSAERQYARSLFPFRKLVLEMAPELQEAGSLGGPWHRPANQRQMLSSTLDADCEAYLNAAKDDFSFFGSEECGQPDTEGLAPIPMAAFREKMTLDYSGQQQETNGVGKAVVQPMFDVLAEVSRFRKAKKAEYETVVAAGTADHVDGHWNGVIEVVRPKP
jgi:hypothetical protein